MNLVGYLIGIAFWIAIGYVAPSIIIKELVAIPIIVLAIMATRQWFKGRKPEASRE
jgi:hypothetical protein